jgi:hypothetical protein
MCVWVHGQEKDNVTAEIVGQDLPVTSPFCSTQALNWLDEAHPHKKAHLLCSFSRFKYSWHLEKSSVSPRVVFDQISGYTMAVHMSLKISHHKALHCVCLWIKGSIPLGRLISGGSRVRSQPWPKKKFVRLCLNGKKLGRVVSPCLPSNSKKLKIAGSQSRSAWAQR